MWVWIVFAIVLGVIAFGFWWSNRWLTPSGRERVAEEEKKRGGWVV